MNGDYDLKTIMKAIPSDISYEEKDNIADGNGSPIGLVYLYRPKNF
jgi:hypothetical protein